MKRLLLQLTVVAPLAMFGGCGQSSDPSPKRAPSQTEANRPNNVRENGGSLEGLDAALKDIETFKASLRKKTPEELILAFVPDQPKRWGGYDYYYKYMANDAICAELKSRGDAARVALRAHVGDKVRLYEAISGPGDTVGFVCQSLLDGKR